MDETRGRFVAFVEARQSALVAYGYMLTGSWADAEDLVQTALIRCLPLWGRLRDDTTEAYVRKVVARLAWQRRRRPSATDVSLDGQDFAATAGGSVEPVLDLRRALAELPRDQRMVLVLRYWLDLPEYATAEMLGCRVGTVKSRTARALERLRTRLGESEIPSASVDTSLKYEGTVRSTS